MTDIVAFKNVVKRYPGGKIALDGISLHLERGVAEVRRVIEDLAGVPPPAGMIK